MPNYPTKFKTAEGRALYVLADKSYGGLSGLAKHLGVTRQYLLQICHGVVPLKYASYLGRKHLVHPGIFNFKAFCLIDSLKMRYIDLVNYVYFLPTEYEYILKGSYIKSVDKFLKQLDKEIKK